MPDPTLYDRPRHKIADPIEIAIRLRVGRTQLLEAAKLAYRLGHYRQHTRLTIAIADLDEAIRKGNAEYDQPDVSLIGASA